MVTIPRTKPTEDTLREYAANAIVGGVIKQAYDARSPEKGISRLHPQNVIWNKRARRYRYAAGLKGAGGKPIGGRFTAAPANAPPERKAGYNRKKKKRK